MTERTKTLLCKHCIDALESAIKSWRNSPNDTLKREYASTIGDIGAEIYRISNSGGMTAKVPVYRVTKTRRI